MYPANQLIEISGKEGYTTYITRQTTSQIGDLVITEGDVVLTINDNDDQNVLQKTKYLVLLPAITPVKQITHN